MPVTHRGVSSEGVSKEFEVCAADCFDGASVTSAEGGDEERHDQDKEREYNDEFEPSHAAAMHKGSPENGMGDEVRG
jgi:hypothetical protein